MPSLECQHRGEILLILIFLQQFAAELTEKRAARAELNSCSISASLGVTFSLTFHSCVCSCCCLRDVMNPGIPVMLAGRSGRSPGNSSSHNKIKWGTHKPALAKPPQRSKTPKIMFFSRTPITICNFTGSAAQTMGIGSLQKPKSASACWWCWQICAGQAQLWWVGIWESRAKEMASKCLPLDARHDFLGNFAPLALAPWKGRAGLCVVHIVLED